MSRLPWLVLFPATAACEREPSPLPAPTQSGAAVHAVLDAGYDTAFVLLTRYPEDERLPVLDRRVTGAWVRIVHGGHTANLVEAPAGFPDCVREASLHHQPHAAQPGCYAARLPRPIRPGEHYVLMM